MSPTNPGTISTIKGGALPAEIVMHTNVRKEHLIEYKEHKSVNSTVKKLATGDFEGKYLMCPIINYAGLMNSSIRQIFDNLNAMHGNMTDLDVLQNDEKR